MARQTDRCKMNLEREIQEINQRLDAIEMFLSGNRNRPAQGSIVSANYDLLNFEVKKSQSLIGPEYSYKLTVRNNSDADVLFDGRIIFLDSSEFEVDSQPTDLFTVPSRSTFAKTGKATITDENHASRIADVTAEVRPHPNY